MSRPPIPPSMYRVAARAANVAWGYDKTLDPPHFERVVENAATGAGLIAMTDAVYRATVEMVRRQIAEDLRRTIVAGAQMPKWAALGNHVTARDFQEWAAGIVEYGPDGPSPQTANTKGSPHG